MFVVWDDEFMPAVGEIEAARTFGSQNPVIAPAAMAAAPHQARDRADARSAFLTRKCRAFEQCFFNAHGVVN
jgi:hypothetical protein